MRLLNRSTETPLIYSSQSFCISQLNDFYSREANRKRIKRAAGNSFWGHTEFQEITFINQNEKRECLDVYKDWAVQSLRFYRQRFFKKPMGEIHSHCPYCTFCSMIATNGTEQSWKVTSNLADFKKPNKKHMNLLFVNNNIHCTLVFFRSLGELLFETYYIMGSYVI